MKLSIIKKIGAVSALAMLAMPGVASALAINIYDAYREVRASSYLSGGSSDYQEAINPAIDPGPWVGDADAGVTGLVCTASISIPGTDISSCLNYDSYSTLARAYQSSSWDLAPDGSSLDVSLYQDNSAYAPNSLYVSGDASIYNYFGIAFTLDEAADFTIAFDYYDGWGDAPIILWDADTSTQVRNYSSNVSGADSGQLDPGNYVFESYSTYNRYTGNDYYGFNAGYLGGTRLDLSIMGVGSGSSAIGVPEPTSLALLAVGLAGLRVSRRKIIAQ